MHLLPDRMRKIERGHLPTESTNPGVCGKRFRRFELGKEAVRARLARKAIATAYGVRRPMLDARLRVLCCPAMREVVASLFLCILLGAACPALAQEPSSEVEEGVVREVNLATPRDTVRTFVYSMQRASGDEPALISDAVRCLDVEYLGTEEDAASKAGQLAAKLFQVLGELGIVVEEVPDSSTKSTVTLWRGDPADASLRKLSVELVRTGDEWRFSSEDACKELDAIGEAAARPMSDADDLSLQVHRDLRSPRATMNAFLRAMNSEPPDVRSSR